MLYIALGRRCRLLTAQMKIFFFLFAIAIIQAVLNYICVCYANMYKYVYTIFYTIYI